MRKVKILIKVLLPILAITTGFYFYNHKWGSLRPIQNNEFAIDKLPVTKYDCIRFGQNLKDRCKKSGGVLKYNITNIGLGITHTLGCYPYEKTADSSKKCKLDIQCEGQCIWLGGDVIVGKVSRTCSDFKKPFFTHTTWGKTSGYYFCDDPNQWPSHEPKK